MNVDNILTDNGMKQFLKKILPGVIFCFSAAACALVEIGAVQKDEQNGVWSGPSIPPPASAQSITYVSAFDYPDGYDWRADPERGEVKCSLVVFREGVPVLKVPVGNDYLVSPDPDMHRIVAGHLYTDFSTETATVVKRDGKPLFSYPEPEIICDLRVEGGRVHTLGHSRSGQGFSYRVNGDAVLVRDSGYTFGRISFEDSTSAFAFSEPIMSADGMIERYYVVRDGKIEQIALRDDITKVWDVDFYNGQICYLASLVGVRAPVLVSQHEMVALSMPATQSLASCRMAVLPEGVCVEGVLDDRKLLQSAFWTSEGKYHLFPKGMTFSASCQNDEGVHYALNPASGSGAGLIYRGGESLDMPSGYSCMSRQSMDFSSGILSVGLSPLNGEKPALWVDGELKEIDANGYICCVASQML